MTTKKYGGITWNPSSTGISLEQNIPHHISRIIIDNTDSGVLYAATSKGIYKTINSGGLWTNVLPGDYHGLEFKPGDTKTLYASGTPDTYPNAVIMKSTNATV